MRFRGEEPPAVEAAPPSAPAPSAPAPDRATVEGPAAARRQAAGRYPAPTPPLAPRPHSPPALTVSSGHDADPRHRWGRLRRLGFRRRTPRGRTHGHGPRRPEHRPRRSPPRRRSPVPRVVRRRGVGPQPARHRADRGDPPLRGTLAGRRVDPEPGHVLPRQRRGRDRPAGGSAPDGRAAVRLLVNGRGLRHARGRRRSPRTPRSGRSTRTARRSARSRPRWSGTAGRTGCAA